MVVGVAGMVSGWAWAGAPEPDALLRSPALVNGVAVQQRSTVDLERRIHAHDPQCLHWLLSDPSLPENVADAPESFNAGGAVWLTLPAPATLIPAATESRDVIFYHGDHLGSAAVMTDRHGALIQETAYFPFGDVRHSFEPTGTSHQPYGFTGKEQDAESELHYFEARYLASMLARFATPDPKFANPGMLPHEELAVYLSKPQKANAYTYALNNPLIHTDPTGLDEEAQVALSVVEGIKQVHAKTGAFAEIVRAEEAPTHWLFVDDQSTVTMDQLEERHLKAQNWRIPESARSRRERIVLPFRATIEQEIPGYFTMNQDGSLTQSERSAMDHKYFELFERTQKQHAQQPAETVFSYSQEDPFLPLMK